MFIKAEERLNCISFFFFLFFFFFQVNWVSTILFKALWIFYILVDFLDICNLGKGSIRKSIFRKLLFLIPVQVSEFNKKEICAIMMHHTIIKHDALEHKYFWTKKSKLQHDTHRKKGRKMFLNIKIDITENKANRKFVIEKIFSRKVLILPDFLDIQPKFPDKSLIFW